MERGPREGSGSRRNKAEVGGEMSRRGLETAMGGAVPLKESNVEGEERGPRHVQGLADGSSVNSVTLALQAVGTKGGFVHAAMLENRVWQRMSLWWYVGWIRGLGEGDHSSGSRTESRREVTHSNKKKKKITKFQESYMSSELLTSLLTYCMDKICLKFF